MITRFLFILFTFCSLQLTAQNSFSTDPVAFIDEFGDFLNDSRNKDVKDAFDVFKSYWQAGNMSNAVQDTFIMLSNVMRGERYNANADFIHLIRAMNAFYEKGLPDYMVEGFLNTELVMIPNFRRTDVKDYNRFFLEFAKTGALNASRGKTWLVSRKEAEIKMAKGPYLVFSGVDLRLGAVKDTLEIENTDGQYFILAEQWYGQNGLVTWERAGLARNDVYAELDHYQLSTNSNNYTADSVSFVNYDAYGDAIEGKLEDQTHSKGENGPYPRFTSYRNNFTMSDLEDFLEYKGGFGMEGKTIIGSGTEYNPAVLTVSDNGQKRMRLESFTFYMNPDAIKAGNTAVTVYVDNDSIIHPNLFIKLDRKNRVFRFNTTPSALSQTPFSNTYHKLEMYVDQMEWPMDSGYIDLRTVRDPDGRAAFESSNFFSRKRFDKLRANMTYHPLLKMGNLFHLYQKYTYTEEEVAGFFGADDIEQIQTLLGLLNTQGFILYNTQNKTITLKEKLFNYIQAFQHKIDYDVILLNSISKDEPNSRLYLEDKRLEINGIKTVRLSDSQNVQIYPYRQQITFKKNRNMLFDGYMRAGRFEYFGKGFDFDYENFQINMEQIDSMMFNFPDSSHNNQLRRVNTVIQNITGKLQIDKPKNKSGRLHAPNFPIFDCFKGAYVYYDYKSVYGGVYKRDRFYFKLKPFVVDSLDNFSMEGMDLLGSFVSADILPTFDYKLNLQPDFSLGFTTETPEGGYPLYKGRGHCNMKIFLSNNGLRGKGSFTFNGAKIETEDMIFFPDSMEAESITFAMRDEDRKQFPEVNAENCALTWTPYRDTMRISAVDSTALINMYEDGTTLTGELIFTKKNMYGAGEFIYRHSATQSTHYRFKHRKMNADSASFILFDLDGKRPALVNSDVEIKLDFDKPELRGLSLYDSIFTDLPINNYSTNIPRFRWEVDNKMLFLEKPDDMPDEDFFFVSTNPTFDSLSFTPKSAQLNLNTYEIDAFNIKAIYVADARIRPDSAIRIAENGAIPPLRNAEIVANVDNEFHFVKEASVNIFSSNKFTGYGTYQYFDQNDKEWGIAMRDIHSTDSGTTVGVGQIPDSANFYFGPRMRYSGDINFISTRKALSFDGELAIEHPFTNELGTQEMRFKGLVSYDSLYFAIDNAQNIFGQNLYSGLFMNTKTNQLYTLFLGLKQSPEDYPIYLAEGDLYFEKDSNAYFITKPERIFEEDQAPGLYSYEIGDSAIVMEGPIGFDYSIDNINFYLSGLVKTDLLTSEVEINLTGGLDLPIQSGAVKVMADSLISYAYFNKDVDNVPDYIMSGVIRHLEDERDIQKTVNSLYGSGLIPTFNEYEPFLHFSQISLVWDTSSMSFHNDGQIGLANVGQYQVNKYLNGRIDFFKDGSVDSVSILLEGNADNWYFMTFVEENLFYRSSDQEFMERAYYKKPKDLIGRFVFKEAEDIWVEETRKKAFRIKP